MKRFNARAGGRKGGHGHGPQAGDPVAAQLQVRGGGVVAQVVGQDAQAGQPRAVAVVFGGGSYTYYIDVARHPHAAPQGGAALQGDGDGVVQAQLGRFYARAGSGERGHGGGPAPEDALVAHAQGGGGDMVAQVVAAAGAAQARQRGAVAVELAGVDLPGAGHADAAGAAGRNGQHVAVGAGRAGQVQAAAGENPGVHRGGESDRIAGPADSQIRRWVKRAGHHQVGRHQHALARGTEADAARHRYVAGHAVRAQFRYGVHGPARVGGGVRRARTRRGGPAGAVPEIEGVQGRVHPQVALARGGGRRGGGGKALAGMQGGIYGVRGRGDLFPGGQALVIHLQLQPQAAALPGRERRLQRHLEHAGGNIHRVLGAGPELGTEGSRGGGVDAEDHVPGAVGQEPALAQVALVGEFQRHFGGGGEQVQWQQGAKAQGRVRASTQPPNAFPGLP